MRVYHLHKDIYLFTYQLKQYCSFLKSSARGNLSEASTDFLNQLFFSLNHVRSSLNTSNAPFTQLNVASVSHDPLHVTFFNSQYRML